MLIRTYTVRPNIKKIEIKNKFTCDFTGDVSTNATIVN